MASSTAFSHFALMSNIPEELQADKSVAPFMARARELADVNPVISYYCRLYVLEYILKNKLHTTSKDVGEFTVGLLDETEAIKNSEDEGTRKVLNDKTLLVTAVVGFAYKLYNSCLAGLQTYDVSKKAATVAKMRAALNFMTLVGMFQDDGGVDFAQLTPGRPINDVEFFKLHNDKAKTLKYQLTRVLRDEVETEVQEADLERELELLSVEKDGENNGEGDAKAEAAEDNEHEDEGEDGHEQDDEHGEEETEEVLDEDSNFSAAPTLPGAPHVAPEDDNLKLPGAPTYLPTDDISQVNKDSPIHMFTPEEAPKHTPPKPAPAPTKKHTAPVTKESISEILDISEHIAKIQKHAKFAISALNYEDLDTAERELLAGLQLLQAAKAAHTK